MKKILLSIILIYGVTLNAQNNTNALDSIVKSFRKEHNLPAIVASVIKVDTVLYGVSGTKRNGKTDPISLNSKFHLGSNTKAITSTVAAKLVEDGIMEWKTKLVDILPELKNSIKKEYLHITLEDLLSHRAGIHPFEDDTSKEWRKIPKMVANEKNKKLAFARYALNLKLVSSKKTNHLYSNGGYIIATLMLEIKSGKSWETLVADLFSRINIDHYVGFPSQENSNSTYGHKKSGKKYNPVLPNEEYPLENYFAPAGNVSMAIRDFSKYIQLHLRGLMGFDNYLTSATYQKLHFGLEKYALGWYNGNIGQTNQKFSYHAGSLRTFSSAVMISADRNVAIVILVNADDKNVNELKNKLRIYLWEKYGSKK